jgi:hypothetical protein
LEKGEQVETKGKSIKRTPQKISESNKANRPQNAASNSTIFGFFVILCIISFYVVGLILYPPSLRKPWSPAPPVSAPKFKPRVPIPREQVEEMARSLQLHGASVCSSLAEKFDFGTLQVKPNGKFVSGIWAEIRVELQTSLESNRSAIKAKDRASSTFLSNDYLARAAMRDDMTVYFKTLIVELFRATRREAVVIEVKPIEPGTNRSIYVRFERSSLPDLMRTQSPSDIRQVIHLVVRTP